MGDSVQTVQEGSGRSKPVSAALVNGVRSVLNCGTACDVQITRSDDPVAHAVVFRVDHIDRPQRRVRTEVVRVAHDLLPQVDEFTVVAEALKMAVSRLRPRIHQTAPRAIDDPLLDIWVEEALQNPAIVATCLSEPEPEPDDQPLPAILEGIW